MEDKEQLEFILSVLKQIPLSETNKWFWNEVLEVGGVDKIEPSQQEKTSEEVDLSRKIIRYQKYKIDTIYEIAVRDKMRVQAASFYESFRISEIKDSLIYDFVRMEHYRRNDDFENFCLALFQQIEVIVNFLCLNNDLAERFNLEYDEPTYMNKDGIKEGTYKLITLIVKGNYADKKAKLIQEKPNKWFFNYKLRLVLFYHYYKGKLNFFQSSEYERLYDIGNEIYQIRNMNHRGSEQTEYQRNITTNILIYKHRNYLKFQGFLEELVSKV